MSFPQHVLHGDDGVIPEHPWSSISHDFPDPFAFRWGIAVDDASGAEVLALPERTAVQPLMAVVEKGPAVLTESGAAMMTAAVDEDHLLDDLFLALDPGYALTRICKIIQLVS